MQDCFQLFGLNYDLLVDDEAVRTKFLEQMKTAHPDMHANDIEKMQEAMHHSIQLNTGFKKVHNFESRAQHLLEICNKLGEEEKKSVPMDFLMEMMEINDKIEDLEVGNISAKDSVKVELTQYLNQIFTTMKQLAVKIQTNLQMQSLSEISALSELDLLHNEYLKLNYLKRLQLNLENVN